MLERAVHLCESTRMKTDPFSDILKLTQAQSLVTGGFSAGGPWAVRFPAPDKIKFFAVVKGRCWVRVEGHPEPARFETGDVGLLSAQRWSILSSDLETEPVEAMDIFSRAGRSTAQLGNGSEFAHIGGHVLLDPVSGPLLLGVLPPWIHIRASSPQAAIFSWLLDQLVEERAAGQPGAQLASAQLSQLLFIQILRAHLMTSGSLDAGWLRALSDTRIAPALRMMHGDPARSWHLDELAKACAMSRTTFAYHFKAVAGVAPLTYLTGWRMRLAERALGDDVTSVSVVAQALGYASESAFSHAFKRVTGKSPKAYRIALRLRSPPTVARPSGRAPTSTWKEYVDLALPDASLPDG
ncbi:AraC family transcriptional regulator [Paraburkholderia phytofirmans]|uniref:AraC family transcriptional regulator n=1 Tax=Paraburkholderia phytofirmans TaxID=261302 RepID=UPI0038B9F8A9